MSNFHKWYYGSKLIDSNGNPIPLFHKTNSNFTKFSSEHIGKSDYGYLGRGYYFTSHKPLDGLTYGNSTMKVFAKLENPYIIDSSNWNKDTMNPYKWINDNINENITKKDATIKWTELMLTDGYDGVIDKTIGNDMWEVCIFYPYANKIKSAFNSGNYSDNDNILESTSINELASSFNESRYSKFITFTNQFKSDNSLLIESIQHAYNVLFEQVYYRGTNNKDEVKLLKSGELMPSKNHITGEYEIGLSVSDVDSIGKYFKYLYKVNGNEVGIGSDGEPLLDLNSIKFIKWCDNKYLNEAVHYGDLGIGNDTYLGRMHAGNGNRGTGHFGTGTYFLSDNHTKTALSNNRPLQNFNHTKYKLLKLHNTEDAYNLHRGLKILNSVVDNHINHEDNEFELIDKALNLIAKVIPKASYYSPNQLNQLAIEKANTYKNDGIESKDETLSTAFIKMLGYNGIDVTEVEEFDNSMYGSVVYKL